MLKQVEQNEDVPDFLEEFERRWNEIPEVPEKTEEHLIKFYERYGIDAVRRIPVLILTQELLEVDAHPVDLWVDYGSSLEKNKRHSGLRESLGYFMGDTEVSRTVSAYIVEDVEGKKYLVPDAYWSGVFLRENSDTQGKERISEFLNKYGIEEFVLRVRKERSMEMTLQHFVDRSFVDNIRESEHEHVSSVDKKMTVADFMRYRLLSHAVERESQSLDRDDLIDQLTYEPYNTSLKPKPFHQTDGDFDKI